MPECGSAGELLSALMSIAPLLHDSNSPSLHCSAGLCRPFYFAGFPAGALPDATAVAGVDYQSASGLLTWGNGDAATKTFPVTITDNNAYGSSNYFTVALSGPSGVSLGNPGSAAITIIQPPLITNQPQNLTVK